MYNQNQTQKTIALLLKIDKEKRSALWSTVAYLISVGILQWILYYFKIIEDFELVNFSYLLLCAIIYGGARFFIVKICENLVNKNRSNIDDDTLVQIIYKKMKRIKRIFSVSIIIMVLSAIVISFYSINIEKDILLSYVKYATFPFWFVCFAYSPIESILEYLKGLSGGKLLLKVEYSTLKQQKKNYTILSLCMLFIFVCFGFVSMAFPSLIQERLGESAGILMLIIIVFIVSQSGLTRNSEDLYLKENAEYWEKASKKDGSNTDQNSSKIDE